MFKIILSSETANNLKNHLLDHPKNPPDSHRIFWSNVGSGTSSFGHNIDIYIDRKYISDWFDYRQDTSSFDILQMINNSVYKLLTDSDPNTRMFPLAINNNKILFLPIPYSEFNTIADSSIEFDLIQMVEEVIRAVREMKNICLQVFEEIYPSDPLFAMKYMLGREELYTNKLFDDPSYNWIKMSNKHLHKNYTKIKKIDDWHTKLSPEENIEFENESLLVLNTYFSWLPLEKIWNEYRKKNNISDADIADAIAKAEVEEKKFIEERGKI